MFNLLPFFLAWVNNMTNGYVLDSETLAAYNGRKEVNLDDIETAAELALPHRVRRQPLQEIGVDMKSFTG
jgi:Mg-chelatase subunit ChlI